MFTVGIVLIGVWAVIWAVYGSDAPYMAIVIGVFSYFGGMTLTLLGVAERLLQGRPLL